MLFLLPLTLLCLLPLTRPFLPIDTSLGEYKKIAIPDRAVEVVVTHVESENLFFANRTGGEKVEKDEDDTTPDIPDDLVNAEKQVTEMQVGVVLLRKVIITVNIDPPLM